MNTLPVEYKPIPVGVAQKVAESYDKSIVVIIAYDPAFSVFHSSTFGVKAEDKVTAANLGEAFSDLVSDTAKATYFEDFRDMDAAKAKVQIDDLKRDKDNQAKIIGKTWVALKTLVEHFGIDESSQLDLSVAGEAICTFSFKEILAEAAALFEAEKGTRNAEVAFGGTPSTEGTKP